VHLVGFIIRIYHDARSPEHTVRFIIRIYHDARSPERSVGFIIRIYHDARSPERQIHNANYSINTSYWFCWCAFEKLTCWRTCVCDTSTFSASKESGVCPSDGLVPVSGRCRDVGDSGDMRHTAVQQHGATSRNTGSAPPPAPAAEVRYPFGVQNDLGQVILSGGAKVSRNPEEATWSGPLLCALY